MRKLCAGIALFYGLLLSGLAHAADVVWDWTNSPDPSVTGYKLYCGNATGVYGTPIDMKTTKPYTQTSVPGGTTLFCAATAYNATLESAKSNEVKLVIPLTPPSNLKVTISVTLKFDGVLPLAKNQ